MAMREPVLLEYSGAQKSPQAFLESIFLMQIIPGVAEASVVTRAFEVLASPEKEKLEESALEKLALEEDGADDSTLEAELASLELDAVAAF